MNNLFTNGSEQKNLKSLLPSFINKINPNKNNSNKLNEESKTTNFFDLVKNRINEKKDESQYQPDNKVQTKVESKSSNENKTKKSLKSDNNENKSINEREKVSTEKKVSQEQDNVKEVKEVKEKISKSIEKEENSGKDNKKIINKYIKEIQLLLGSLENQNTNNQIIVKLEKLLKELEAKLLKLFDSKENKYKNLTEKNLLTKLQSVISQINKKLVNIKDTKGKTVDLTRDNLFTLNIKEIKKQIKILSQKINQHIAKNHVSSQPDTNKEQVNINNNEVNKLIGSNNNLSNTTSGNNDNDSSSFQFSREFQNNGTQNNTIKNTFTQTAAKNTLFDEQLKEIINKSRMVVKNEKNASMSLKLNPKNLGKVNINLGLENGLLNGKFLVDSQDAKNALLESLEILKENLGQNGVSIGEFQVNVREQKQFFNNTGDNKVFHSNGIKNDKNIAISDQYEKHASLHDGQIDMVI